MEKLEQLTGPLKSITGTPATYDPSQKYILGLRGFLVIESFIWVFLMTFVPTAVKDATPNTDGPGYQVVLREVLSPIFWNGNLIYSSMILLSARSLAIPFFKDPTKSVIAGAVFRRGLRLWFPVACSLAIVTASLQALGFGYIEEFKAAIGNVTIQTPYSLSSALFYFNSVFNLFWVTNGFATQSASIAFPSQTLWIITVIYMQSFTVFMVMVIAPYTRASWRVKAAIPFIISAWWVQSWAWYSVTGLSIADMVMHMDFKGKAQNGIPIFRWRLPSWVVYVVLMAAGLVMQYIWTDLRPDLENSELYVHTGLNYGGDLNVPDLGQPQARDDNYLLIVGFMCALETYDWMQAIFSNPVFVYLGKRSLSWFLVQSIIIYTAGIKLFMHLYIAQDAAFPGAAIATLIVTLICTIVFGEMFHWLVDAPSQAFARFLFDWIRT